MPYIIRNAAKGVIYFDDGVSYEKNIRKTEIYYTYLGNGTTNGSNSTTVNIDFVHYGSYSNKSLNQTYLRRISIINPFRDPVSCHGCHARTINYTIVCGSGEFITWPLNYTYEDDNVNS